jgi:hypothetical protein
MIRFSRIATVQRAVLVVIAVAASLAAACGSAWAAASPVSWMSPVAIDDQPPFASPTELHGVSCPSSGLCIAVDDVGDVLVSTDPTGGTAAWTSVRVAEGFTAVACPSTELCVAVGKDVIATATDPTGGAGAWSVVHTGREMVTLSCASASLCVATDEYGAVWTSTDPAGGAGAWSETPVERHELAGIACPSTKLCVAVDREGSFVTSTDPTGGAAAWTTTLMAGNRSIRNVSCATEYLCVATDGYGEAVTSTDPTGGAGAWSATPVIGAQKKNALLERVSCTSWGLCVAMAGNEVLTSTDPTGGSGAWSSASLETASDKGGHVAIDGASCPAADLCVLVDGGSQIITSAEPTGGADAWTITPVEVGQNSLSGVSCASIELCVWVDEGGNVVTSTDPTGGSAAWSEAHVIGHKLDAVSCPTVGFCVAVDEAGDALVSKDPTGGSAAWGVADIDGTLALEHVSCASASLCVATDREGGVLVSTDPAGGAGAWSRSQMDDRGLGGVACPSEQLCVITEANAGQVLVSNEPTGGAGSWAAQDDAGAGSEISCPSASLCLTSSGKGPAIVSWGDPLNGTWSAADFEYMNGLSGISCAPDGTCVATSFRGNGLRGSTLPGNVIATSEPTGGEAAWIESNLYGIMHPSARLRSENVLPLEYALNEVAGVACVAGGVCFVGTVNDQLIVGDPQPATALERGEAPSIRGSLAVGKTAYCAMGTWTWGGESVPTFTYRWLREGLPIAGASAEAYVVQTADAGEYLECEVTATKGGDHKSAVSVGVLVSMTKPENTASPSVSGTPAVGEVLACANGAWTGGPTPILTVQWLRGGAPIPGATGSSYRVQTGDAGESLACEVTSTNNTGQASATSAVLRVPAPEGPAGGGGDPSGGEPGGGLLGSSPLGEEGGSVGSGSTGGGAVSNAFALIAVKSMVRLGVVELTLSLPGPGKLELVCTTVPMRSIGAPAARRRRKTALLVARLHLTVEGGRMVVTVIPDSSAKRLLAKRGALEASVALTYTPQGVEPRSIVRSVAFRSRRRLHLR